MTTMGAHGDELAMNAQRTSQNAVNAKFGRAPVLWARNSRVVGALRVATPCYTTEQRTLPSGGVRTPERRRHAALEVQGPAPSGRLLQRTSENSHFPRTWVNKGRKKGWSLSAPSLIYRRPPLGR